MASEKKIMKKDWVSFEVFGADLGRLTVAATLFQVSKNFLSSEREERTFTDKLNKT